LRTKLLHAELAKAQTPLLRFVVDNKSTTSATTRRSEASDRRASVYHKLTPALSTAWSPERSHAGVTTCTCDQRALPCRVSTTQATFINILF